MTDNVTPWDASLKVLLSEKPQDFASWLLKGAVVKRRFQQMYEPFRETPIYKEMTKFIREEAREEALKARKEGREEAREEALKAIQEGLKRIEEERQKRLQDNRQTLINLVQKLFPSLVVLAKKQAENTAEPFVLQAMITKMFSAQTLEEAIQYLIEVPDATEKRD